ncbi:hypothetical protein BAE44_0004776 [Dichanthelium oligosanthes]|uniref:DUF295 domain-containing protein n=1 Tax=Dichanthelium oligosanthes TaxID=888268 RepID=A0A1E5W9V0_9POAL|nr:hypothetical protein BAE44_0004776 [Dichanthelium oligosanthes]
MVVRFGNPIHQLPTLSFKVFEAVKVEKDGEMYYLWCQHDTLGGRIISVGQGCSRSYEADQYVRFGLDEGVYFLDDGSLHDNALMFAGDDDRAYPCSDNGFWSGPPDTLLTYTRHNPRLPAHRRFGSFTDSCASDVCYSFAGLLSVNRMINNPGDVIDTDAQEPPGLFWYQFTSTEY